MTRSIELTKKDMKIANELLRKYLETKGQIKNKKELRNWIKKAMKAGATEREIKKALEKEGWTDKKIEKLK